MFHFFKKTDVLLIILFLIGGTISGRWIANLANHSCVQKKIDAPSLFKEPGQTFVRKPSPQKNKSTESQTKALGTKHLLTRLLKKDDARNWEEELKKILAHLTSTGEEKTEVLLVLFSQWAEIDFDKAWNAAGKIPDCSAILKKEIFIRLAQRDPKAALAYYENHKDNLSAYTELALGEIAENWSIRNPAEALDWCLSFENMTDSPLYRFMKGIGYDSDQTRNYIDKIQAATGCLPGSIITDWAAADPEAVLTWGECHEKGKPFYWQSAVLSGMINNDPKRAAKMFSELPENERNNFFPEFYITDTATALSWKLDTIPPSQINKTNLSDLNFWTKISPTDSAKWINSLPYSPTRDIAIELYVENVPASQEYKVSLDLLNKVEDTDKKQKALQTLIQKWQKSNPEKFDSWLKQPAHAKQIQAVGGKNK